MIPSKIEWIEKSVATRDMCYEAISLLYVDSEYDVFGDRMAFALSCSRRCDDSHACRDCIHKLDIQTSPSFTHAKMKITHEVQPQCRGCSQISYVNDKLRVASFDSGTVIPIKNFGPQKTFNCDVRAGLTHHAAPIYCMASKLDGTQIATGTTGGEIGLFDVERMEELSFLSLTRISSVIVTGLHYLDEPRNQLNNHILYATQDGILGVIDPRVGLAASVPFQVLSTTNPRLNISALTAFDKIPGPLVYVGTSNGTLGYLDLRKCNEFIAKQKLPDDECIRKIKPVTVHDKYGQDMNFIAYANGSKSIKILSAQELIADTRWTCDRMPSGSVRDICQVGTRLVTCGEATSIGCWIWDNPMGTQIT